MSKMYGFGVAITEQKIVPKSAKALLELIAMAPAYNESCCVELAEYAKDRLEPGQSLCDLSVQEILDTLNCFNNPQVSRTVAHILEEVIQEAEEIEMDAVVDDYTDDEYLVFIPKYPWKMTRNEYDMTDITLTDTIAKYIAVISDIEPIVKEQTWQWCD